MASAAQVDELRRKISEPDTTTYSNETLSQRIDDAGSIDEAASDIWSEKASMYSELVDISEAGSSRKNSQLMQNAISMAQFYAATDQQELIQTRPTTSPIRRAE